MAAPTKQELIDSLVAMGVKLIGDETVAQLKELIEKSGTPEVKPVEPGTIIKTYVQNGLRYNRVATENGGTVDVRA